jgi:hypothetical protein
MGIGGVRERRTTRSWWLAAGIVAAGALTAAPAVLASTQLSFATARTQRSCGFAAYAAGPENCDVTPSVSISSGAAIAQLRLVSPGGGAAPWSATAMSSGDVVATYHLSNAVPELDFAIAIHVNRASVTIGDLPAPAENLLMNLGGSYYRNAIQAALLNEAGVSVGASAWSPECGQACNAGTNEAVLSAAGPGATSVANQDYVLRMVMRDASGGDIPAGDVNIAAGVDAAASELYGPGNDSARIEAVVTGISMG